MSALVKTCVRMRNSHFWQEREAGHLLMLSVDSSRIHDRLSFKAGPSAIAVTK